MARDKKTVQKSAKGATATVAGKEESTKQGKKSKQSSYDSLRDPLDRELALLGLRVKQITADGNCFFRALSDQLEGKEQQHSSLRARVVELMQAREEDFAPFVEDDQSFEAYTARMRREGTWAGHMELQAASLVLQSNIVVYQAGQPRWSVTNFPPGSRLLHLSYHDGEHYNSVRRADDYGPGPPAPIDDLAPVTHAAELQSRWSAADEARVAAGTGCDNPALIKQQLAAAGGDVDAAIEAIIEILAAEDEPGSTAAAGEAEADAAAAAEAAVVAAGAEAGSSGIEVPSGARQQQQTATGDLQGSAEQQQAANIQAEIATKPSGDGDSTLAEGQHGGNKAAGAAAEAADSRSTSSKAGQSMDQAAASSASASSTSTSTSTAASKPGRPADAGGSSHSKGIKLKGGSKVKHANGTAAAAAAAAEGEHDKRPSRNKACPCGSGRKHKNCCGLKGTGSSKACGKQQGSAEGLSVQLATLHI